MPDLLNALRRLYGEPGPEGIPAAGDEAEVRALAEVKAGLDALPKRRPDAATLDAILTAVADPALAPDDDAAEAAVLAEVKAGLDALPRRRPDATTLEAVLAAAVAPASSLPPPAADRPAQRPSSRRRAAALGAAFVLVLAVASVLWIVPTDEAAPPIAANALQEENAPQEEAPPAESDATLAEEYPASAGPPVEEPVAGALADASSPNEAASSRPAPERSGGSGRAASQQTTPSAQAIVSSPAPEPAAQVARTAPALAEPAALDADANELVLTSDLPLADGDDELRMLYLRTLEMQAAQAGLGWDEPPTALGTAPDSVPAAAGWMQVRVER